MKKPQSLLLLLPLISSLIFVSCGSDPAPENPPTINGCPNIDGVWQSESEFIQIKAFSGGCKEFQWSLAIGREYNRELRNDLIKNTGNPKSEVNGKFPVNFPISSESEDVTRLLKDEGAEETPGPVKKITRTVTKSNSTNLDLSIVFELPVNPDDPRTLGIRTAQREKQVAFALSKDQTTNEEILTVTVSRKLTLNGEEAEGRKYGVPDPRTQTYKRVKQETINRINEEFPIESELP